MKVRLYNESDRETWDSYVLRHPDSTHCQLSGWKSVIENTYGHKGYYLLAEEGNKILGILPLFHMRSFLFKNQLVSMPYLNYGGILADFKNISESLMLEGMNLCSKIKASLMELRQIYPIDISGSAGNFHSIKNTHKVRMVLELPGAQERLFASFKSKLRSQILRPQKAGLEPKVGGAELIEPFYKVFSINMRDLGSPVHAKRLFQKTFAQFGNRARVGIVFHEGRPVAAGLILCFRDTVEIPWASSLRKYNNYGSNMLLYWSLLKYACEGGYKYFDFGRSTPGEGTFKFKEQWGARPFPLHWRTVTFDGQPVKGENTEKNKFKTAITVWRKIPVSISKIIGPLIRKNIEL